MATKYYAVLTNVGAAKLAKATALGAQVEITQMAVGDGNGALPTPNPAQTALVHELRRAPLNTLSIDQNNANQIIAEQVIPEEVGGWWIREIGLFDEDGDMIAVANCAETYKPQLQEGSGRVQIVRMILIVSSTAAVTLKIDPSVVLATRAYVDSQIISAKSYADDLMGTHLASENPHDQYPLISNALKEMADAGLVDEVLKNLGLSDVMKTGDFGLGVKNETKPGGMAALGVTQFDYFEPADNIGPLPGSWCGGLSYAMGDDIGFQLAGSGQLQPNENPRLFFRSKFADKTFTQWGEIYHTLNKPTASDLGITLGTAASRDVGTGANQIPDMSSFTSGGNADARWRKLPDGTIEQFGIVNGMTTNAVTVAYPIAFPSELTSFEVAATGDLLASSYNTINIAATPAQGNNLTHFSATGYNTFTDGRTALNNVMFYWRAIGR
ncbi:phage tail protein [Citrobacter freundii]|uniref:phage tail protein n=1 Tax=Citrobacter freundii TaxID=546 RepID=UPI001E64A7D6|nr:phage tail protein [Citrobacter freundii]